MCAFRATKLEYARCIVTAGRRWAWSLPGGADGQNTRDIVFLYYDENGGRALLPAPATLRNILLVMLSLAAGCVDAAGFLGFDEVFVANMTGNTVLLGIAIGQADSEAVLHAVTALAAFICGVAAGAIAVGWKQERDIWPKSVTLALAIEFAVLVGFAGAWLYTGAEPSGGITFLLISLSALAMGIQSSAVRRLGVPGVATTYITGTLTNLTETAIDWLRTIRSPKISGEDSEESPEPAPPSARGLLLPADVWLAYGTGAVVGGAAQLLWWPMAVLFPAIIVATVVFVATIRHRHDQTSG